jgi:hypothetical protein
MHRTQSNGRRRTTRGLAATTVAVVALALCGVFASPAVAATGDTHFFMSHREFFPGPVDVLQSTRVPSGAFAARVNVTDQAGELTANPLRLGTVKVGSQLHLLVGAGQTLLHSIRRSDGTWPPFAVIDTGLTSTIQRVVAANVGGQLQVVIQTLGGAISHAARASNGTWTAFGDVETQAGQLRNWGSFVIDVAGAGFANGQLQVLASTNETIVHTVRRADGTWTRWADVIDRTGNPGSNFGSFSISAAAAGNDLHLLVLNTGVPFHALRSADGSWTRFGNVFGQTGDPGSVAMMAATGYASGGQMLFAVRTIANSTNAERTMFTIRGADGAWGPFTQFPPPSAGASGVGSLAVAGE